MDDVTVKNDEDKRVPKPSIGKKQLIHLIKKRSDLSRNLPKARIVSLNPVFIRLHVSVS